MLVDKNLPPASLASSSSLPDYYSCTTFNSEFKLLIIFNICLDSGNLKQNYKSLRSQGALSHTINNDLPNVISLKHESKVD